MNNLTDIGITLAKKIFAQQALANHLGFTLTRV